MISLSNLSRPGLLLLFVLAGFSLQGTNTHSVSLSHGVLLTHGSTGPAWGFFGHRRINRMAVFTLPESELFGFYKRHIAWLEEHAVDPDKRRYAFAEEAPRHFIDLDRYGPWPHDTLPRDWDEALELFGEERLINNGIAPWHIERTMAMLRAAFRDGHLGRILRHSTDLGHYLGDLHVPLHCTENYNGGLTGQHGIHGFWESRLPELYAEDYDYLTGRATYIRDISGHIWSVALASSAAVDSVLLFEKRLSEAVRPDARYSFEERGQVVMRVYSRDYSYQYHTILHGMVERRMRASILAIGSFWLSAWIDAGRPPLPEGDLFPSHPMERLMEKAIDVAYSKGKIKGRSCSGHESEKESHQSEHESNENQLEKNNTAE